MKKKITAITLGIIALTNPLIIYAQNFSNTWQNHNNNNIRPLHATHQNINANNFHTNPTERFMPANYSFNSGPDYRHVLGQATFAQSFTRDMSTLNIRRDAQGSNIPPRYGIFSGNIPTHQMNSTVDMNFANTPMSNPWQSQNTSLNPVFDTTQQGINFINNSEMNNNNFAGQSMGQSQGQMLTPTSIIG